MAEEEVYTVGYFMSLKGKERNPRLALWRWERGKVNFSNVCWQTTVTASSPVDAVKKGQQIREKELENAA